MKIGNIAHQAYVELSPVGELDANSSVFMDEQLNACIQAGASRFLIDGTELTYISSAGVGVFVSYMDEIRKKQGKIVFSNLRDNVKDVFRLLGVETIADIADNEQEAQRLLHS